MAPRILPSVTTLGLAGSTWQNKLEEIARFQLQHFALFLTGATTVQRFAIYEALARLRSTLKFEIPFVHATSEMQESEYLYLMDQFNTERFNLHPERFFPLGQPLRERIKNRIYIENSTDNGILLSEDIEGYAGVCLDLSHLEELRRGNLKGFQNMLTFLSEKPIGANHISGVRDIPLLSEHGAAYSTHIFSTMEEFDYLDDYDLSLFSSHVALEAENSISEQMDAIDYIDAKIERRKRNQKRALGSQG